MSGIYRSRDSARHALTHKPFRLQQGLANPSGETFPERVGTLDKSVIEQPLTRENYKEKMRNLICWEEVYHIRTLGEKCNGDYNLVLYQARHKPQWLRYDKPDQAHFGYLEGISSEQVAYATQASEAAYIVRYTAGRKLEVKVDILSHNYNLAEDKIYLAFNSNVFNKLCVMYPQLLNSQWSNTHEMVTVEFEVNHRFFNNLIKAVNGMHQAVINRLMPLRDDFAPHEPDGAFPLTDAIRHHFKKLDHSSDINKYQLAAMKAIVFSKKDSPPTLINGSFGTGKTRIFATAAYFFTEFSKSTGQPARVLICAHHQHSADHLIKTYFEPMKTDEKFPWSVKLIRLNNREIPKSQYDMPFHTLSKLATQQDLTRTPLVVVTTFLTSFSFHYSRSFRRGFFTHILIDEGGQAREPEVLSPLCLATEDTKIAIAGDPFQVGPALLVLGPEARENGLKYSLLQRLYMEYRKHGHLAARPYMLTLRKNYRCHEAILAIPKQLFYNNLECAANMDVKLHPGAPYPLLFVCSSLNKFTGCEIEANLLLDQIAKFVEKGCPWIADEIAVVTTTQTQLVTTRKLLRKHASMKDMKFNMLTTYKIQGQEFQALFWSTIEPISSDGNSFNPTKSPCDPFVFNTVLTRAKSLVVAVGSPLALLDIEEHMVNLYGEKGNCWSVYIKSCLEKNTLFIPESVEQDPKVQNDFRRNLCQKIRAKETQIHIQAEGDRKQVQADTLSQARLNPIKKLSVSSMTKTVQPATATKLSFQQGSSQPAEKTVAIQRHIMIMSTLPQPSINPPTTPHTNGQPEGATKPKRKKNRKKRKSPIDIPDRNEFQTTSYREDDSTVVNSKVTSDKPKAPKLIKGRTLPNVPILRSAYYQKHKDKLDDELLKDNLELTAKNYKEKFHHLLCVEEEAHHVLLQERCDREYEVTFYQPGFKVQHETYHEGGDEVEFARYGYIDVSTTDVSTIDGNADDLSYAKQASQGSFIFLNDDTFIKVKHIFAHPPTKANFNAIVFALTKKEAENLKQKGVYTVKTSVKFELKHSYFHRLHNAIKNLPENIVDKLVPSSQRSFFTLDGPGVTQQYSRFSDNLQLDQSGQIQALHSILNSSPDVPILIAGPFGTGKTRLLARATFELLKVRVHNYRVLVCAHHQASADTFMEYFGEMKKKGWGVNLVRVVPNRSYLSNITKDYKNLYKTKNDVHDLTKYKLVVTTLGTAPALVRNIPPHKVAGFFTHILIDEGAQTREPETIGPLCFANQQTKIIIAGDHLQVGPKLLVLGEKAQKHGLGISLLERLHKLYEKIGDATNGHSLSLLTNHRCHSGIVTLASSLFYGSTIQFDVSEDVAHPLAEYPLQFICSDFKIINHHVQRTEVDEEEAKCLLDAVSKFVADWPGQSLNERYRRICVMSSSADQCNYLRRLLNYKCYSHLKRSDVEIRKAYDIQGTEFRAIFIGTSEITSKTGESLNPLKSVCDPFVFNTAITRSKSLVVAVGNPFLLLSVEEHMVRKYDDGVGVIQKWWSQYMKRCLECDTFFINNRSKIPNLNESRDLLYEKLYEIETQPSNKLSNSSILHAYRKVFERLPAWKKFRPRLSWNEKGGGVEWSVEHLSDSESSEEHRSNDNNEHECYPCVLNILSIHEAEAIPTEAKEERIIKVRGKKNRLNAFNGDKVLVKVINEDSNGKYYGRVKKVLERKSTDCRFICQVSLRNPVMFSPLDKKSPNFYNLPRLSREMLSKKSKVDEIKNDLRSKDVVVFSPNSAMSIRNLEIPQIQQVIPLSVARNMMFIVSFVQWKPKYRSPLGMVIGTLPKGTTALRAERLLLVMHNVKYDEDNAKKSKIDAQLQPLLGLPYNQAFTIDPDEAENLDDALSLVPLNSSETQLLMS